jgi:RNA polymerase primary sigma factor
MPARSDTVTFDPRTDTMPNRQNAKLLGAAQRGDRVARDRVVATCLGTVRSVAYRYRDMGLAFDDLVQEGSLGALDAIDDYDPARGADFETYVRFRVRRAIRNALTDQSRLIRLPKQIVERRRALDRAEARLTAATGRRPTKEELASATGLTPSAVVEARGVASAAVSLDQPVLPDGSSLDSVVADGAAKDPELEAVEHEQARRVDTAVSQLPARQREIVSRHFGLGRRPEGLAEVAAALHVSQQRVRAIERDALYALRDRLDTTPQSPSFNRR